MFSKDVYSRRRAQLIQTMSDDGLILLLGNKESSKNCRDNTYRFRQDNNFLYFMGWDRPHLAALIDTQAGTTTLLGQEASVEHIVWMGPQPSLREMADRVGAEQTESYGELSRLLAEARAADRKIHYLPPYRPENSIELSRWLEQPLDEIETGASEALIDAVVRLMAYKSEEEIEQIENAVNITREMHLAVMRAARPGMREAELAGIAEGIAVGAGGDLAYPVILTINGQTLHNHYHGNRLLPGRLVLGDFGAETNLHYAGDITRTFPVDAQFTQQQKHLYQLVLQAETAAMEALQPGIPYRDIHLLAARIMADGLRDLGLMTGNTEDAVAAGAHALFFPHGLGHMLGLGVHDMEDLGEDRVGYNDEFHRSDQFGLRSLRLGRPLEPGFVLTVEPGLYFIPELIAQWQKEKQHAEFIAYDRLQPYLGFGGIRIEDNVLITQQGYRLLGKPIPKAVKEIEEIRAGALAMPGTADNSGR